MKAPGSKIGLLVAIVVVVAILALLLGVVARSLASPVRRRELGRTACDQLHRHLHACGAAPARPPAGRISSSAALRPTSAGS